MDELARIERIYGCVQEYYRCMEEERERYEPTEEEILEHEKEMYLYHRKIEILNGKPSELAVKLNKEWAEKEPDRNDYYAGEDWSLARRLDIVEKICKHYGVEADEEYETFYRSENFSISVEYIDYCNIKYKHIGNLSYEMFQNIFRDLDYCRLYPSMKYGKMIRSNMSLGNLKITDLKWNGIETEESLQTELLANGYNEEEEIKRFLEGRK